MLREMKLNESYEDYMQPAILWATADTKKIARALDVIKVVAQGVHITSLFGGEKKIGAEQYAGLVVTSLRTASNGFYVRLYNTDKEYLAPTEVMKRYGIDIYKLFYLTSINPFKCSAIDVVFSSIDESELREFIRELIRINKKTMTRVDERKLEKLAEEVRGQVKLLDTNSHYVMYRGNRIFSACVPEVTTKSVSHQHSPHIECKSAEQAHYYAAVLNYMAYKVIERKREFMRSQYSKPSLAIAVAGLSWRDTPPQLRDDIARLSYTLSKNLVWREYSNQRKAILEVAKVSEFKQITKLLDSYIEAKRKQKALNMALELVSSYLPVSFSGTRI